MSTAAVRTNIQNEGFRVTTRAHPEVVGEEEVYVVKAGNYGPVTSRACQGTVSSDSSWRTAQTPMAASCVETISSGPALESEPPRREGTCTMSSDGEVLVDVDEDSDLGSSYVA